MNTTFIYALCEPGTRIIRYIGKSNDPEKRFRQHLERKHRLKTHLGAWLRKVEKPDLMVLKSVPVSEWEWWEQSYIRNAKMLGFDLVNDTPGGDGVVSPTAETRQKMSAAHIGKKLTAEQKQKIGASHKGQKRTEETRQKMRLAQVGKKATAETRQKLSAAHIGKKLTGDHKQKIGASQWGRKLVNSSSSFIGVSRHSANHWQARIRIASHNFYLGLYLSEIAAAQAYDWVAALFGRPLNFPEL